MKPENVQKNANLLHQSSTDELEMLDYLVEWARIKYECLSPTKSN
jgi:two-component system CheB/CheR fusion protein